MTFLNKPSRSFSRTVKSCSNLKYAFIYAHEHDEEMTFLGELAKYFSSTVKKNCINLICALVLSYTYKS